MNLLTTVARPEKSINERHQKYAERLFFSLLFSLVKSGISITAIRISAAMALKMLISSFKKKIPKTKGITTLQQPEKTTTVTISVDFIAIISEVVCANITTAKAKAKSKVRALTERAKPLMTV